MARTAMIAKANRAPKYGVRRRSRCEKCGRPRGFLRRFRLCRLCFRHMALRGLLPGVIKASW